MLQACQPSVIRTETPSFWRLKSLSFEGHLEKKMKSIFGNQVYATVFGSISTICFSAGDEAQRCRVNWTKTGRQHMGPYRYLLPQAYFPQSQLNYTVQACTQEFTKRVSKWKWKNEFGRCLQPCTNYYCVGSGARPRAPEADRFEGMFGAF